MFNSFAICAAFTFFAILIAFNSALSMGCIVLIFKTLVKMKNDNILAYEIGQRLKEFRQQVLEVGTQRLAHRFNQDHADEPIRRGQITNWEKSPGWEYLFWLNKRCKLNLIWALKGKPHRRLEI